jgi:hypothetical protein
MVMIPPFQGGDPGSIPGTGTNALIAQLVERTTVNREVFGSIPNESVKK